MTAVLTASTPLSEPRIHRKDRRIEYAWEVGQPTHKDGETTQRFAVLTVASHHPDNKRYFSHLSVQTETSREGSAFYSVSFGLFNGFNLLRVPSPRFSQKMLNAVADDALQQLRERFIAGDTEIVDRFQS